MLLQCDTEHCCLIVTTGGTGPAQRDVTPDATEAVSTVLQELQLLGTTVKALLAAGQVCERMMPGYGEQMRMISLK